MSDLTQNILEIIHKPQLTALATVTEMGNPWVRYVITVGDGDMNLRCATMKSSRKVQHIKDNPNVHLSCGVTSLSEATPYLQIQAQAMVTEAKEERHNFWNEMLEPIFDGPDDPDYTLIIMQPYRIEYCTPGSFEAEVWSR